MPKKVYFLLDKHDFIQYNDKADFVFSKFARYMAA